jgi:hypothetical protein
MFIGGSFGYEMAGFAFGDKLFSVRLYGASSFAGSIWFMPFFLLMRFHLVPSRLVIGQQGFSIPVG